MIMEKIKKIATLSVRRKKDVMYLTNGSGQEWKLPKGFSERAALSMLVYGALLNKNEDVYSYSSNYRISMEVEVLDGE